jgi:DNA-binding GntR family transcriptional regulator
MSTRRILNCLRKGRLDRAQRVLSRHLSRVLDAMEELKASHGAYFE